MKPVALVTGTVSDYREEPFRLLAERVGLEVLAFEGPGRPVEGLVVRSVGQLAAARLVASGAYRAVICGLGGRLALPATYAAARRARIPFVLWASLWAHPRTLAHALSYLPTLGLYRSADAVATYGPHVSGYVRAHRRRPGVVEAPQAVSAAHFGAVPPPARVAAARADAGAEGDEVLVLFVGRLAREKGVDVLLEAWRRASLGGRARLALAGDGELRSLAETGGPSVQALGRLSREDLPALYAAADVVVLPSVPTETFLEPWGLVVNEAMHQSTPVIASDAVGAVAGGLVVDGRNGLIVPHGDAHALAARLRALVLDAPLRERLGRRAGEDVGRFSETAWAEGMGAALAAAGVSR